MTYSIRDAKLLYGIEAWGNDYFGVNARGNLTVHPLRDERAIDLFDLIPRLERRKVRFPFLLRFPQILESRVGEIFDAFGRAIDEFGYAGSYRGVFPIKVNQMESVVGALVAAGRSRGMGLEAGSKAELAVALSHELADDALIICNGYKDPSYIRLALRGRAMGKNVVLIAEKPQEIDLIVDVAAKAKIEPVIGIRIRLVTRGSGKWERSSGPAAKFGLATNPLRIDTIPFCVSAKPTNRALHVFNASGKFRFAGQSIIDTDANVTFFSVFQRAVDEVAATLVTRSPTAAVNEDNCGTQRGRLVARFTVFGANQIQTPRLAFSFAIRDVGLHHHGLGCGRQETLRGHGLRVVLRSWSTKSIRDSLQFCRLEKTVSIRVQSVELVFEWLGCLGATDLPIFVLINCGDSFFDLVGRAVGGWLCRERSETQEHQQRKESNAATILEHGIDPTKRDKIGQRKRKRTRAFYSKVAMSAMRTRPEIFAVRSVSGNLHWVRYCLTGRGSHPASRVSKVNERDEG